MTVYFQGTEEEAYPGTQAVLATGVNTTYSREGCINPTALSGASLSDFWVRFTAQNSATILAVNDVAFDIKNAAGAGVIRAIVSPSTGTLKLQYLNASAVWTDTGVSGISYGFAVTVDFVVHVKRGAAGASVVECWYNNLAATGNGASPDLSSIANFSQFGYYNTRGNNRVSEVVIADENLLLWNVKTAPPSVAGTDTDGTGAVTDINEATLSDLTYVELTATGQRRSTKAAARTLTHEIKAVTVSGRLMRVDATGPQQVKPYLLISGTRYYGTTFALTTGFSTYQYTWRLNPSTSAAWTLTAANDALLESGWEAVA